MAGGYTVRWVSRSLRLLSIVFYEVYSERRCKHNPSFLLAILLVSVQWEGSGRAPIVSYSASISSTVAHTSRATPRASAA